MKTKFKVGDIVIGNETATAHCSPRDEFDFLTGAKLAVERLREKRKGDDYLAKLKFKVGDRVKYITQDHMLDKVGTVVGIKNDDGCPYLVSFDGWRGGHDGKGFYLAAGNHTPDNSGYWCLECDLVAYEDPEFKVGDWVRIIDNGHPVNHYFDLGDIVEVLRVGSSLYCNRPGDHKRDAKTQYVSPKDVVLAEKPVGKKYCPECGAKLKKRGKQ